LGRSNLMPGEENFFTNRVVASLRPLRQIAAEASMAIEQLTVKQVVAWFVKDGKIPTEQGVDAAFWICELYQIRPSSELLISLFSNSAFSAFSAV
jgi:hypothetical protein